MYFQDWRLWQRATKGATLKICLQHLVSSGSLLKHKHPRTRKELFIFETKPGRIEARVLFYSQPDRRPSAAADSECDADAESNNKKPVDTFASRKFVERNRGGIVISDPIEFPCTGNGAESRVVVLIENTGTKAHTLTAVQMLGETSPGAFSMHLPSARRINPNTCIQMPLHVQPTAVGVCRALVSFQFGGFVIGRYVSATCGDPDLHEFLKPTAPYKKKERKKRFKSRDFRQIIDGKKVDFGGGSYVRKMKAYPRRVTSLDDIELLKILPAEFDEMSVANYCNKQNRMLAIEENRLEDDLQQYNIDSALLRKSGQYLALAVPGLAEKRPSVLTGDSVLCPSGGVVYRGYVHMVLATEVFLKFDYSFHAKHINGARHEIQFVFPRRTMRILLQGLSFITPLPSNRLDHSRMEIFHQMLFPLESVAIRPGRLNMAARSLNVYQTRAVESIIGRIECNLTAATDNGNGVVAANPPYVVFGPPGTGKTKTVVEAIYQASRFKTSRRLKILVCAPSNTAADVLLTRLAPFMNKSEMFRFMSFTRNKEDVSEVVNNYCKYDAGEFGGYTCPSLEVLKQYQVVVATCGMAGKLYNNGIPRHHFDMVVVDECGHAWESEVVASSSFSLSSTGLLVLAGDPMQLGPVTHSDTDLKVSMLERLLARPLYARDVDMFPDTGGYDSSCVTKLLQTYRCHPAIIKIPNELFYDNDLIDASGLEARSLLTWEHLPKPRFPLIFHGVNGENQREGNSPSWFNQSEVEQVLQYVQLLKEHKVLPSDIGVIAPYQKQVQKIRMGLRVRGLDKDIMVGSCEQFQGQERRVIIISTVRTSKELIAYDSRFHLGFVANSKRMNVAITRAKALLIVVGSPAVLNEDQHWRCLLKHCHDNGAYTGTPFHFSGDDDSGPDGGLSEELHRMQLDYDDVSEPPPYDGGETKEI
jgi:helicase MOV-10